MRLGKSPWNEITNKDGKWEQLYSNKVKTEEEVEMTKKFYHNGKKFYLILKAFFITLGHLHFSSH